MDIFTRYTHVNTNAPKVFFLALLICFTTKSFATVWTTSTAGPINNLANWTNGTSAPTSFTTPGDTWNVTMAMTMSTGSWIVGTSSMALDTVIFATGGSLAISGAGSTAAITIYGNLLMNGGTLGVGGAGCTGNISVYGSCVVVTGTLASNGASSVMNLSTYGDYYMTGGIVSTSGAASGVIAVNVHGTFNMSGGSTSNTGSAGGTIKLNIYGNGSFNGTAAMVNGAGCTSVVHFALPSGSGTMLIDNTSTGVWSQTNVYVDTNCTAQLDGNFSSSTGASSFSSSYGVTVNGTLICPAAYMVNGTGNFTLNGLATLEVAIATGIDGAIITTGTTTFSGYANYVYNGSVPQVTGLDLPYDLYAPSVLTISNSAGVTLSQSDITTGTLAFTSGILHCGGFMMSTPGTASSVTGAGPTSYVDGILQKTISGLTSVNYEVGNTDYTPMQLTFDVAGTGGSMSVLSTQGLHPSAGSSGLSTSNMVNDYWTVANLGASGPGTVTPMAIYNAGDIIGGSNTSFLTQEYASSAWLGAALATTNTSSPFTSTPTTGIPLASIAGDYIYGNLSCGTLAITGTPTLCATATTSLTDATTGGVWGSSNTGVATVSTTGLVTGVAAGTAVISYTASACTVITVVTVNGTPDAGTIAGVNFVCTSGTTSLSDATGGGTWSSSNTGVATVSGGSVTAVGTGSTVISYTVTNGCGSATATVNVTVGATLSLAPLSGIDSVCPGSNITLTDATGGGTWTSTNSSIATVTGGVVSGVAPGYDTIIYTVTTSCGTDTVQMQILVRSAASCASSMVHNSPNTSTSLNIFPNPNAGSFTVKLSSDIDEAVQIVITNIMGEKVQEYTGATNKAFDIQITHVPGIYLVSASGAHGRYVARIIVE